MNFSRESQKITNLIPILSQLTSSQSSGIENSGLHGISSTTPPPGDENKVGFMNLTHWQLSQLNGLSIQGIQCLVGNWMSQGRNPITQPHCNATWDDIYCWPHALAGETIRIPCTEILKDDPEFNASTVPGDAYRVCTEDAIWLWGNWTNYNDCMTSVVLQEQHPTPTPFFRLAVTYTVFLGSILSLLSLCAALYIFYKFRSLRCDRVVIHIHLMIALAVRFLLLIIMVEPFVFQRTNHYKSVDWLCKTLFSLQFYAQVASINWMFIQGHYLHSKLTSSVFDGSLPIICYIIFGWGTPLLLIVAWATLMTIFHDAHCWKDYGELPYNWILVGPMLFVLFVNMIFLMNIIRILCSKMQVSNGVSERDQFRRVAKATIVLFPLLGINNLLFFYSPGPEDPYHIVYLVSNSVLQSSQGIFVALFYCFLSKDVKDTLKREYSRFWAQRRPNRGGPRESLRNQTGRNRSWRASYRDILMKRPRRSTQTMLSVSYMPSGCQNRERIITITAPGAGGGEGGKSLPLEEEEGAFPGGEREENKEEKAEEVDENSRERNGVVAPVYVAGAGDAPGVV